MRFFKTALLLACLLHITSISSLVYSSDNRGGVMIGYPAVEQKETKARRVDHNRQPEIYSVEKDDRVSVAEASSKKEAQYRKQLQMREKKISILEQRVSDLRQQLKERESELYGLRSDTRNRYEVRKNDNLWKIAARPEVYGNAYMWIKIYNANIDRIKNPNVIYPGQLFEIPE